MAVQVTLNGNRRTITDLKAGRVRKTVYTAPTPGLDPWTLGVLAVVGLAAAAPGIYRLFTGQSEQAQAMERLKMKELEAKLRHDDLLNVKIAQEIDIARQKPLPSTQEEQKLKLDIIRDNAPLDLHTRELTVQKLEQELARNRAVSPFVDIERELSIENLRGLIRSRQQVVEDTHEQSDIRLDRERAETELTDARADQIALQTRLLETAVDGMDFFNKQIFLRERLFPEQPERKGFISPGGVRTVVAF